MNKKNKVLLSTVGLLLLSGIAATSSTFAWFTTVRSATINYSEATATTTSGDLTIAYKSSRNTVSSSLVDNDPNKIKITGANAVTDISGDGINFYKPVWASQSSHTDGVASIINTVSASAADGFYVDFTVTVGRSNDLAAEGLKVYLGDGTKFTDTKSAADPADDVDIVPSLRLAVIGYSDGVSTSGTASVKVRWAPAAEASPTYLTTGSGAYGTSTHSITADSTLKSGAIPADATTQSAAATLGYEVADLSTSVAVSADITFRAWIEGTDTNTINDIIGETFSLDIDLYALAPNA